MPFAEIYLRPLSGKQAHELSENLRIDNGSHRYIDLLTNLTYLYAFTFAQQEAQAPSSSIKTAAVNTTAAVHLYKLFHVSQKPAKYNIWESLKKIAAKNKPG